MPKTSDVGCTGLDLERQPQRLALFDGERSRVTNLAIAPFQDVLGLGSEARMNFAGTAEGNWRWRMGDADLKAPDLLDWLGDVTRIYER